MNHLNYCRQMVKQYSELLAVPSLKYELRAPLSHAIDLARISEKFLLPKGGRLFDDLEFKALDESEPLRLPYPMVALEHESIDAQLLPGQWKSSKRIIFAREREGGIAVMPIIYSDKDGSWQPMPEVVLPQVGFLDRTKKDLHGRVGMNIYNRNADRYRNDQYGEELATLLCFLNALQCSNVKAERLPPPKQPKKTKGALPFDSYHILTIGSVAERGESSVSASHRSPREHLRRGHIRRYESGLKIWVNASVVNAGVGGKISKDYQLTGNL